MHNKHRLTLAVALLFAASSALAESPALFEDWIPSGWKLISSATGDLNQDGLDDAVLVVEEENADKLFQNELFGAPVLNLNPRRLIVLFNTQSGYREFLTHDKLLPSEHNLDSPCLADPLLSEGGIAIEQGRILIRLGTWLSCGGYGVSSEKFTFRFEDERFRLIGYDYSQFSRSSGEASEYSVNYLTGRKKATTGGNVFEDTDPSVSWSQVSDSRKFYLEEMSLECYSSDDLGCNWYR
jgi:hypothetical protein